jgi:hypothetical protein
MIGRLATPGGRYLTSRPPSWPGTSFRVIWTDDRESGRPTMTASMSTPSAVRETSLSHSSSLRVSLTDTGSRWLYSNRAP